MRNSCPLLWLSLSFNELLITSWMDLKILVRDACNITWKRLSLILSLKQPWYLLLSIILTEATSCGFIGAVWCIFISEGVQCSHREVLKGCVSCVSSLISPITHFCSLLGSFLLDLVVFIFLHLKNLCSYGSLLFWQKQNFVIYYRSVIHLYFLICIWFLTQHH